MTQSRYVDLLELPADRSGSRLTTIVTPPERYVLALGQSYELGIVLAGNNQSAEPWTLHIGPQKSESTSTPIVASSLRRETGTRIS